LAPQLPKYQDDLPSKIIEDVKVRCLFTMQVVQKRQYIGMMDKKFRDEMSKNPEEVAKLEQNILKMKKKMTSFGK
jgi:hypothetical protein